MALKTMGKLLVKVSFEDCVITLINLCFELEGIPHIKGS
jgi:hypothetical protein